MRKSVANTSAEWAAAASGLKSNVNAITFAQATGSWGTVTQFAIMDSGTYGAGNVLYWGDLTVAKAVAANDTVSFASGDIDISET